jgi:hypothetical protein
MDSMFLSRVDSLWAEKGSKRYFFDANFSGAGRDVGMLWYKSPRYDCTASKIACALAPP